MRIPDTVKILYRTYRVEEEENIHEGEYDLFGKVTYLPPVITLNAKMEKEQKENTFLHEVIHALDDAYVIGLSEKQVERLGSALYVFARDNPGVFEEV